MQIQECNELLAHLQYKNWTFEIYAERHSSGVVNDSLMLKLERYSVDSRDGANLGLNLNKGFKPQDMSQQDFEDFVLECLAWAELHELAEFARVAGQQLCNPHSVEGYDRLMRAVNKAINWGILPNTGFDKKAHIAWDQYKIFSELS